MHARAIHGSVARMKIPNDYQAIEQTIGRLEEILGERRREAELERGAVQFRVDGLVSVGPHTFAIEWKRSGAIGQVALAANRLARMAKGGERPGIPLLAVPYMGVSGKSFCAQMGVSWLDLSGNSSITAEGLYVRERNARNLYSRREPVVNPFGPRGSRIARWLISRPGETFRQRELATAVGLNEGYTSRVTAKLLENELVTRGPKGISVLDYDLLLDSWEEAYRFSRHALIPGHIPAISGMELAHNLAETLNGTGIEYAMTGLAAAWLYSGHATFRLLTVYLGEAPSAQFKNRLALREEPRGANVWLAIPNDKGVFQANETIGAIRCVHPAQAYLDLQEHPERSKEAAAELRSRFLTWSGHDR